MMVAIFATLLAAFVSSGSGRGRLAAMSTLPATVVHRRLLIELNFAYLLCVVLASRAFSPRR